MSNPLVSKVGDASNPSLRRPGESQSFDLRDVSDQIVEMPCASGWQSVSGPSTSSDSHPTSASFSPAEPNSQLPVMETLQHMSSVFRQRVDTEIDHYHRCIELLCQDVQFQNNQGHPAFRNSDLQQNEELVKRGYLVEIFSLVSSISALLVARVLRN